MPDGKYLVIEGSEARPASVLTVSCLDTKLISFSSDAMIVHPVFYRGNNYFGFCQENFVQTEGEKFIKYDDDKKLLMYYYGNNYLYSNGVDVDTLRRGSFKYRKGQFRLVKETFTVNNREEPENKETN